MCAATLCACQSSPGTSRSGPAPDPIVSRERIVETRCPAELDLDLPARVAQLAAGVLEGDDAGMAWLRAHLGRENALEDRLRDARAACAKP